MSDIPIKDLTCPHCGLSHQARAWPYVTHNFCNGCHKDMGPSPPSPGYGAASRDEILTAASNGNPQALEFLRAFARRAHWVDDLCDRDKLDVGANYSADKHASMESEWLLTLAGNPFFLAHRAQLVPAMRLALNAWVDSGQLSFMSPSARDVVKGQWHEVVWMVADLTGGWEKMREVSSRYRSYDFEESQPEPPPIETQPVCAYCAVPLTPQYFPLDGKRYCGLRCAQLKQNLSKAKEETHGLSG